MQTFMAQDTDQQAADLAALGWSAAFADQVQGCESHLTPARIATVHRARLTAESTAGPVRLVLPFRATTAAYAVGDWVLLDPGTRMLVRRLDRNSLLQRRVEGTPVPQLIAANVDTLFIVSSCNSDLNAARLERYLAVANEAGMRPIIVLTKADQVADVGPFRDLAAKLQRGLDVVTLNAKAPEAAQVLAPWCGPGQTVA